MLTPKIIGFCGYPGSGKDEAASVLVKHGWQRIAFADKLREMALAIDPLIVSKGIEGYAIDVIAVHLSVLVRDIGWLAAKRVPEVRRLLQRIGTEGGRDILGENTWVDAAERSIPAGKNVVFTDPRFANEAAMIRSRGGKLYWLERRGVDRVNQHVSEDYPFEFDGTLRNCGTIEELHNQVLELVGISL